MKTELSIVIPLFNEADNIKPLFIELNKLEKLSPKNVEVILVNDGSTDNTVEKIKITKLIFRKKIISFSRNFGHQSALIAGLRESTGKMIITMDGDLQHPPELITKMVDLYKNGFEIVLTKKIDSETTSRFKKITSLAFYKIINLFSNTEITESSSDFRLIGRKALDNLLSLQENRKFLRGLINWIGFDKVILPFNVQKRANGESKYTIKKMMTLAFSGITSFSTVPLYFAGTLGLLMSVVSAIYGIYVVSQFLIGKTVSGWTSMLLVLLVIGSFILIFLGIIGLYIAAIYDEVKKRPNYIIKEIHE